MDAPSPPASAVTYTSTIARRVDAERVALAGAWLDELKALLPVAAGEVFPSQALLDHIPGLIGDIARYVEAPEAEEIAANTAVIEKAQELGVLRHTQRASVHQILREYELLAETLESFVASETARLKLDPSPAECIETTRRLTRAISTLMRATVDTFVSAYAATIERQTDQLRRFTRIASHELRSPIGTLVFAAELLRQANDGAGAARLIEIVGTNAERLRQLVNTLHRVAMLDPGMTMPTEQRIEVRALAADVARQLADMADTRGVTVHVDPRLPALVTDPARLELVLVNLLSNAIKYADPQKPDRTVEISLAASTDFICTLMVRDNGLGIPEESLDHVFTRHFRAHGALDEVLGNDGSGLGLPIVAECVNGLRGAIRCESRVGHGTTIYIDLPIRPAGPDDTAG
jgi:signal transduction histidine kinase